MRLASRDNSVAGNELGEDTTGSLNTEGKCGDVDEDDILSAFFPREATTLNSSTICDSLIRVDTFGSCWTLGIRVEPPTSTTLFETLEIPILVH